MQIKIWGKRKYAMTYNRRPRGMGVFQEVKKKTQAMRNEISSTKESRKS
jgi:hypothetical protein